MNRKRIGVGLALAAMAALVGYAQTASAIDTAEKFTVVAPADRAVQQTLDVGPKGPSLGDRLIFSGPLLNRSATKDVGRIDGVCTITSAPAGDAEQNRQQCQVTATIGTANGETEIELQGVGRVLAEDVVAAVTGGTGRYQNARGQAVFDLRREDRLTIHFSLIP